MFIGVVIVYMDVFELFFLRKLNCIGELMGKNLFVIFWEYGFKCCFFIVF